MQFWFSSKSCFKDVCTSLPGKIKSCFAYRNISLGSNVKIMNDYNVNFLSTVCLMSFPLEKNMKSSATILAVAMTFMMLSGLIVHP